MADVKGLHGGARLGAGRPKGVANKSKDIREKAGVQRKYRKIEIQVNFVSSKLCWDCGERTCLLDFHKDKSSKDGRTGVCKVCSNIRSRRYFKENRTSCLGLVRAWNSSERGKEIRSKLNAAYREQGTYNTIERRHKEANRRSTEDYKKKEKQRRIRAKAELSNSYIAKLLRMKVDVIPAELYEMKRAQVLLRRLEIDLNEAINYQSKE
jgi:hypothetical protein